METNHTCPPCTGNCSQGRQCPAAQFHVEYEQRPMPGTGIVLAVGLVTVAATPMWVPLVVHLIARWAASTP